MPFRGKQARGGKRNGAGRKPTAATVLKRRIIENKIEEAEASFAFLVAVRENDGEPTNYRITAADMILDRVLGKPNQTSNVILSGLLSTDDISKLSEDERRRRILELLELARERATIAALASRGTTEKSI